VESTVLLTLSALLLGVTVTTAAPAPPESNATELAAFDAPPPTMPPIAMHRSELRDPFAAPRVRPPVRRPHSELADPFSARARAQVEPKNRSPDVKAPF
jgi:hypothetical protein